jgi:hypothetical protein
MCFPVHKKCGKFKNSNDFNGPSTRSLVDILLKKLVLNLLFITVQCIAVQCSAAYDNDEDFEFQRVGTTKLLK